MLSMNIVFKYSALPQGVWFGLPDNVCLVPQGCHFLHFIQVPFVDQAALPHHAYQVAELVREDAVMGRAKCSWIGLEALLHYVNFASSQTVVKEYP